MIHLYKKLPATVLLICVLCSIGYGQQKPLIPSRQTSYYTYIYQLTAVEALRFHTKKEDDINPETMLHTVVDSFKTNSTWVNKLPAGNYLKVYVNRNRLAYALIEKHSVNINLLRNNYDLNVLLTDPGGTPVNNAVIKVKNHEVPFDAKTGTYHINYRRRYKVLEADYLGVSNFFELRPGYNYRRGFLSRNWRVYQWARVKKLFESREKSDENYESKEALREAGGRYTGFIVFNKPKYKLHDTVRFKAFVLYRGSRKPITADNAIVRIKEDYDDNGKILGTIKSYRDGGFEYSFVLTDSLKLILDGDYIIAVESLASAKYDLDKYTGEYDNLFLAKRDVYAMGKFRYEDYDLKGIRFNMRTDVPDGSSGKQVSVYLKATDENNLPVPDGRVTLTVLKSSTGNYLLPVEFIPDTLWQHRVSLEPAGETKVTLPDSIFPKAYLDYSVHADFLNSNNEHESESLYLRYNYEAYSIDASLQGDTLKAKLLYNGKPITGPGFIYTINSEKDTISKAQMTFPLAMMINPYMKAYSLKADSTVLYVNLNKYNPSLDPNATRTKDSIFIKMDNPRHVPYSYWVFDGNHVVDEGSSNKPLSYQKAYDNAKKIDYLVDYVWAGESKFAFYDAPYKDKILTVHVKQPLVVYPGQKVETEIQVKDIEGRPVPNTDLTAWSLTRKFNEYAAPFVPYLGDNQHVDQKPYNVLQHNNIARELQLNWEKLSRKMGLDSIAYYQFTHTKDIYRSEETVSDTITQVSPFVVHNGDIVGVELLYIDERPVYFSQAEQLQRYSFKVSPGKHKIRMRTGTANIVVDDVVVEKGKKLILGVNSDTTTNKKAKVTRAEDTLSNYEALLLNKYMIRIVNNFKWKMATVEQGDQLYLLNPQPDSYSYYQGKDILAGPLPNNYADFQLRGEEVRPFMVEPGYGYTFETGVIKQKSIDSKYPFQKFLYQGQTSDDYSQQVLTRKDIDTIWQNYLDLRSHTMMLFQNDPLPAAPYGHLDIRLKPDKNNQTPFIKNIIIYRENDPDFIRIFPGNRTELEVLPAGNYRIFFLLKNGAYSITDHVQIRPHGENYYLCDIVPRAKDSVSIKINDVIESRSGLYQSGDGDIHNDALKLKEAFNEKYLDVTGFKNVVTGRVIAIDDGLPVPGATVKVKGTNIGTVTNSAGKFTLPIPAYGKIVVSFIGYLTEEITVSPGEDIDVRLKESANQLGEVVVTTALGVKHSSKELSFSTSTISGSAAGVYIRGIGSPSDLKPLIIIDGVPVESMADVDPGEIQGIQILKDSGSTAIYGIKGGNGVIVITTKKRTGSTLDAGVTGANEDHMRKSFSDYAYWQPKLNTDASGIARFTTTFPDDITNWRTFVIAVNGQRQTGSAESEIKAFRPISANFVSPQFAVKGDQVNVMGKVLNYTSDTVNVQRNFSYNGKPIMQDMLKVKNSHIDTLAITAEGTDSLSFEYTITQGSSYFDGETRKIPLIEQGTQETKGVFDVLEKDTTVHLKFDASLGPVTFRAEASVLPVLLDETEHLRNYKYLCNEQLASKLIGLLAQKRIKKFMGEPFEHGRDITAIIKKVMENRRSDGAWGWWKDTEEELWVSLHVVDALLMAEKEGYQTNLDKFKLTMYLVYQLESYNGQDKLYCMQLLRGLEAKIDYKKYANLLTKTQLAEKHPSKYDQFRLMLVKEQLGLPVQLDSLFNTEHRTLFGNVYWGENSYRFFDNSIQLTILAYNVIKMEGKHPELLPKIRGYFLEQRRDAEWRNTYESSLILETILPEVLNGTKEVKPVAITLSGAKGETVSKFPYTVSFTGGDLVVSKTGSLPVYITGYQQFWNRNPEKVNRDFEVNTWFERNGNKINKLKGGEPVELKAEVIVKGDADYVMINIPIPAGCSYENKDQNWQNEAHREYFKDRLSVFSRKLKQGKYLFTIKLIPRYGGDYNMNPAKAEMMYFPVFYGREGMKKVVIGE